MTDYQVTHLSKFNPDKKKKAMTTDNKFILTMYMKSQRKDTAQRIKDLLSFVVLLVLILFLATIPGCSSSSKASKHQNGGVADRLRQIHAPVKSFKPNLK